MSNVPAGSEVHQATTSGPASQGKVVVVGITASRARTQLGDVVYVELPKVGATVDAGEAFGTVESVKAVSELFAPISGKVVKVNDELERLTRSW